MSDGAVYLKVSLRGRKIQFSWGYDGEHYRKIGQTFDLSHFSDEYSQYGEFTGTFVGITCADRMKHAHYADFDFFSYKELKELEDWQEREMELEETF